MMEGKLLARSETLKIDGVSHLIQDTAVNKSNR